MQKKECQQVFDLFVPLLNEYKIKLDLRIINDKSCDIVTLSDNELVVNLAHLKKEDFQPFIAYYIQKIIMPLLNIKTNRLTIRRVQEKDLHDLYELASCEEVAVNDGFKPFSSLSKYKTELFSAFLTDKTRYSIETNSKVIGIINLRETQSRAVTAFEIGYAINKDFWRQGYAFEALTAVLEFCLNKLHIDLITANCFEENFRSQKLLKKLGFEYEGKIRKAFYPTYYSKAIDEYSYYIEKAIFNAKSKNLTCLNSTFCIPN